MRCARLLLVLIACLGLGACGSGERAAEVTEVPSSTSTAAPTTSTSTQAEVTPASPPPTGPTAETGATGPTKAPPATDAPSTGGASADAAATGGAGDEEPIRQPARFELGSVSVTPASVAVAPFLAVELEVVNVDEGFHAVKLVGTDVAFTVQGGQTVTRRLPGLKAGMYTLSVDAGKQAASLVVGDQAGP